MDRIDDSTVTVYDEDELADAVSSDYDYEYIYLGNDITLTKPITIDPNKARLTIDGLSGDNYHTINEKESASAIDSFGIRNASSIKITMKNMVINGANYYGIPYVYELMATDDLEITYENVIYTGPQIAYNLKGLVRFINCEITIQPKGLVVAQEVGEVNRVEIGGNTTIIHTSTNSTRAVFWFLGDYNRMSFTVLPDANVTITSVNNYFMYNYFDVLFRRDPVPFYIRSGAKLTMNMNKGISYTGNHRVKSMLIEENAKFIYRQMSENTDYSTMYLDGTLTVSPGAEFYMEAYNNTQTVIVFTGQTSQSLIVDNPASFVGYNQGAAFFRFAQSTEFALSGGQLNYWQNATTPISDAGDFEDLPYRKWHKNLYASPLEITGTVGTSTTHIATENLEPEDEPYDPISGLQLHDAPVLSIGDVPFRVDPIFDNGDPITGETRPNANVRAVFTVSSGQQTINGTADSNGAFSLATSSVTPPELPADTVVTMKANTPFLIVETDRTVQETTVFIESAPSTINYLLQPVLINPTTLPREYPTVPVVIFDNRPNKTTWRLLASITHPLTAPTGETLPNALVFRAPNGTVTPLSATPLEVSTGGGILADLRTNVSWDIQHGMLVEVNESIRARVVYSTVIRWDLEVI